MSTFIHSTQNKTDQTERFSLKNFQRLSFWNSDTTGNYFNT